jgi:hypothetical protein
MPRETTEEEEEEDDPLNVSYGLKDVEATAAHFEVVDERVAERVGVQSVHEDGRRDIGKTREDDDTRQEHLPRFEVEEVKLVGEQTDKRPVQQRQGQGTSNGVVPVDQRMQNGMSRGTHDEMYANTEILECKGIPSAQTNR